MKAKITEGTGFGGCLDYAFEGKKEDKGKDLKRAEIVSSNMGFDSPNGLRKEFQVSKSLRPEIKKPVWHCSLSLPKKERLESSKWDEVIQDFLQEMKIDSVNHQYVAVRHQDTDYDHVHIILSRIGFDSQVWHAHHDVKKAIRVTQKLEQKHGLVQTKGLRGKKKVKNLSSQEIQMAARKGEVPARMVLQKTVEKVIQEQTSIFDFLEKIESTGVKAIPNVAKTGRMNGFSFEYQGVKFKGSDLGENFKWKTLQEKVIYNPEKEAKKLIQEAKRIKNEIKNNEQTKSNTTAIREESNRDRTTSTINKPKTEESRFDSRGTQEFVAKAERGRDRTQETFDEDSPRAGEIQTDRGGDRRVEKDASKQGCDGEQSGGDLKCVAKSEEYHRIDSEYRKLNEEFGRVSREFLESRSQHESVDRGESEKASGDSTDVERSCERNQRRVEDSDRSDEGRSQFNESRGDLPEKTNQNFQDQDKTKLPSSRGRVWDSLNSSLDDLAAPIIGGNNLAVQDISLIDQNKKVEAWRKQHDSLLSPEYRVNIISRDQNKIWVLSKPENQNLFSSKEVEEKIPFLRKNNAQGNEIHITPIDPKNHYIVIHDLTEKKCQRMLDDGVKPCLIQESSHNLQAVIKAPKLNDKAEEEIVDKVAIQLNQKYGNPNASKAFYSFQMAGFRNKKQGIETVLTRIVSSSKEVCRYTINLLKQELAKVLEFRSRIQEKIQASKILMIFSKTRKSKSLPKGLLAQKRTEMHQEWKKRGSEVDYIKIDFWLAHDLLKENYKKEEVVEDLANCDLSKEKEKSVEYALNIVESAANHINKWNYGNSNKMKRSR